MRILLVAHEFPPGPSPQSLRWGHLSRELARRGHRVTVLTTRGHAEPARIPGVRIVRTSPGRLHEGVRLLRRMLRPAAERASVPAELPVNMHGLNWRGRIVARLTGALSFGSFPDLRAGWNHGAAITLRRLVAAWRPDIVVASHEPANVLELGLLAGGMGIPWVADLGDPVLAPYTPRRWRLRAGRLERRVCAHADLLLVTSDAYRDRLVARGVAPGRCMVLRQGFPVDRGDACGCAEPAYDAGRLELLFTGQFYRFRRPEALFDALAAMDAVRFTVISQSPDAGLLHMQERLGEKLRLVGALPHRCIHAWQARADVLVNIGNRLPLQIPGKLFEYFGAGRGILHLSPREPDESARLVLERKRGWVVRDAPEAVAEQLLQLHVAWRRGELDSGLDLSRDAVIDFSWPGLAGRLEAALEATAGRLSRRTAIQ